MHLISLHLALPLPALLVVHGQGHISSFVSQKVFLGKVLANIAYGPCSTWCPCDRFSKVMTKHTPPHTNPHTIICSPPPPPTLVYKINSGDCQKILAVAGDHGQCFLLSHTARYGEDITKYYLYPLRLIHWLD